MAVTINASTSAGLVQTADTTGNLSLQSNGTTIAALTSTGLAVTGAGSFSTTLGVTGTSTLAAVNASGSILASNGGNYLTTGAAPVYIGGRSTTGDGYIGVNVKVGVGNYVVNGFAGQIIFGPTGGWDFNTAASGTAGNVVSDTSKMSISNTGAVTIPGTLGVTGTATFTGQLVVDEDTLTVFTAQFPNVGSVQTISIADGYGGYVVITAVQGGIGTSSRTLPFVKRGGSIAIGSSSTAVLTGEPISGVSTSGGNITVTPVAANTYITYAIYYTNLGA